MPARHLVTTLWAAGQRAHPSIIALASERVSPGRRLPEIKHPAALKPIYLRYYLDLLRYIVLGPGRTCLGKLDTLGCVDGEGREILTLGEGFNTQVITLWCFYIVGDARHRPMESSPELYRQGWHGVRVAAEMVHRETVKIAPTRRLTRMDVFYSLAARRPSLTGS